MTVALSTQRDRRAKSVAPTEAIDEATEQIKQRIPLEEIVAEVVDLKPDGRNRLKGLCPFHNEKSPSFKVDTEKGLYKCWGCPAKGDVFTFVMEQQGLSFPEAKEYLAERAGVELSKSGKRAPNKDIFDALNAAQDYFVAQLLESPATQGYLLGRGLTLDTVAQWGLGYAPDGWQNLIAHMRKDYGLELLERAGLVGKNEQGRTYDFFRNRVTIPIRDTFGRIVGFSARALSADEKAKYINTPETEIFKKGDLLFGLDRAKDTIRTKHAAIIVEGHLDVIALHQGGFSTAVGAQSATLTERQITALERLGVTTLHAALDNDDGGRRGTMALCNAVARRMIVRVVQLRGKDPAEMMQDGSEGLQAAIDGAIDESYFIYNHLSRISDPSTREGKNKLLKSLKPYLSDLTTPGDGHDLRTLVESKIPGTTVAELKTWASEKRNLTLEKHAEAVGEAETQQQMLRDKFAGEIAPFPVQVFPKPLREYVQEHASALPVPPDYIATPMLCVLATAIGHSRKLVVKKSWTVGIRIWAAIVGSPGSKKSPALQKANDPLIEQQRAMKREYDILKADHDAHLEELKATANRKGDSVTRGEKEPEMRQILVTDATREALVSAHVRNPRAISYTVDELAGLVGGLNQYKGGGKGNDKQFFMSSWSGEPIYSNRKGNKEPEMISEPFINIYGGIQPDILPRLRPERGEDGFVDRFLFSYPAALPQDTGFQFDDDVDETVVAGYRTVVSKLMKLEQAPTADGFVPKPVKLDNDAKAVFKRWMDDHAAEMGAPDFERNLEGAWSKFRGYFAQFALALHLTAYVAGEESAETVSATSVRKAAALVEYYKNHTRRVYRQLGDNPEDKMLDRLRDYIVSHGGKGAVRDLVRAGLPGCKNAESTKRLLQKLADAGVGSLETVKKGGHISYYFAMSQEPQGVG